MGKNYTQIPDEQTIQTAVNSLTNNGISSQIVPNGDEAKKLVQELIPAGDEVFTATSVTLAETGIADLINNSGKYESVRQKFSNMDRNTQKHEMTILGSCPKWVIGSIHALTQDGSLLIASNTGSQLPAYVYGAEHVIFVVGAQKIVDSLSDGLDRIYKYVLPLESKRMSESKSTPITSFVSKLLIINREVRTGRMNLIIVKEKLGF